MILLPDDFWEIKNTSDRGKGVFAKKDINPGVVIGDYLGKVIPLEEEDNYDNGDSFYLMYYDDKALIYPDLNKPGIHMLNHSCTPTCWMYTYKGHTLYFALRKIFQGEELTVSYLLSPLDKDCDPCTHLCQCGSVLCTQIMHLPQKRYDIWDDFDDEIGKKTKREEVTLGQELPKLTSYPDSIPDDKMYTLFGSIQHTPEKIMDTIVPSYVEIRKLIRVTGKTLQFPAINLHILGVQDNVLISENLTANP